MEFGSFDVEEDGENNNVCFVKLYKMLAIQNNFFFGKESFDRLYWLKHSTFTCASLTSYRCSRALSRELQLYNLDIG